MKVRTTKKRLLGLILTMSIVIGTVLGAMVVSNAYIPTTPVGCSGLWYNGEYQSFSYGSYAINPGYSESYVLSAYGYPYSSYYLDGNKKVYLYYNNGTSVSFVDGVVTKFGTNSPTMRYSVRGIGSVQCQGATMSDVAFIVANYMGSGASVCRYPNSDLVVYSKVMPDGKTKCIAYYKYYVNGEERASDMSFQYE